VRILRDGGNAIDAGVATVFAASICEISHFGFGGETPTMIYDAKTRDIIVINGQGPAPKAATPSLFSKDGKVPSNGPLGATIPAMLDAMAMALETRGTMRLEQVMAPAIELADGFPMYAFLRDFFISERKATNSTSGPPGRTARAEGFPKSARCSASRISRKRCGRSSTPKKRTSRRRTIV